MELASALAIANKIYPGASPDLFWSRPPGFVFFIETGEPNSNSYWYIDKDGARATTPPEQNLGDDYTVLPKEEVLAHHGIPGMKWGIRRFQNKDGSYTSAGKRRRQQADDAADSEESKSTTSGETAPSSASSSESHQTAQAPPAPDPDEAPQREGMSPEQRRALLLAGAGVVAAATIIGVSLYNAKHEGNADAGKAFLEKAKTVKIPKIDVEDDATAAKDAATAVLKSREMEQKLRKFSETENPDPKAYQALSEAYFKAYTDAERATERKENVSKFVSANKDTILSDPKLVTKYADFLTSKDIASVKDHLSNKNNLHDARVKQAKAGAEWLGVITAVGGAVNEVYKLKNTDIAKDTAKKVNQ